MTLTSPPVSSAPAARSTAFSAQVSHDSGAVATVSSEGGALQFTAVIGQTPYAAATLGVEWDGELLGPGSVLLGQSQRTITEDYASYVGKAAGQHHMAHEEATFAFRSPLGREWFLIVRVAADGFAFRYKLKAQGVVESILGTEHTTFELSPTGRAWTLDYHTWYETVRFGVDLDAMAPGEYGFPTLVDQGENAWILLTESGIDGRSSGAHIVREPDAPPAPCAWSPTRGPCPSPRVMPPRGASSSRAALPIC